MLIDAISIVVGLAGLIASRVAVARWATERPASDRHAYWLIGLVALVPAWLIAFVTLLPTSPGGRPALASAAFWILSASAGLIGAIVTEARVRIAEPDHPRQSVRLWRLGVLGFVPAWLLALIGHALS